MMASFNHQLPHRGDPLTAPDTPCLSQPLCPKLTRSCNFVKALLTLIFRRAALAIVPSITQVCLQIPQKPLNSPPLPPPTIHKRRDGHGLGRKWRVKPGAGNSGLSPACHPQTVVISPCHTGPSEILKQNFTSGKYIYKSHI